MSFLLSCESTVDLPFRTAAERGLSVLFYTYAVDGTEMEDDMFRTPDAMARFYSLLAKKKMPTTSQVSIGRYLAYFEELLSRGDVLHIAFGSGMTPSVRNAEAAAAELRARYPDRRIVVLDSLCSSCGYGLLTEGAADLRDQGASLDEAAAWVSRNARRVHHQFFSADLTHYRRSGRIRGAAALAATVLGICPVMRLDAEGRILVYAKVRGRRAAIAETVRRMEAHAEGGRAYAGRCVIAHSACPATAEALAAAVRERFPAVSDLRVREIGTVIAAHCGPGTVACFFFGDEREPEPAPVAARCFSVAHGNAPLRTE